MSSSVIFLIVIAVVIANQAVLRVAALRNSPAAFWSLQGLNMVFACYALLFGIPGLIEQYTRFIGVVFGLLIILRVLQNNMLRQRYLRQEKEERARKERAEAARRWAQSQAREE